MNSSNPTIHLRAIEPEDLDLLYRIENDVKLWNVGTSNVPYSRYTLHDYVAHASADIYTDRQVRMMVENEQHEIVGIVDVVNFDPSNCRAEVGLIILNEYRRQGYGSRTLEAVADYALNVLHLHQLFAYIDDTNEASLGLFQKMGYEISATIKDWLYDGKKYRAAVLAQRVF
jgi:diamine N-acetyltransferase